MYKQLKKEGKAFVEFADGASQNFADQEFVDAGQSSPVEVQVSRVGDRWQVTVFDSMGRRVDGRYGKKSTAVSRAKSVAKQDKPSTLLVLKKNHGFDYERNYG